MENSDVGMLSVLPVPLAVACLTQIYSPFVILGGLVVQLFKVPPDNAAVANVYVNVPLNEVGALDPELDFL